jgi:hypothetical protein
LIRRAAPSSIRQVGELSMERLTELKTMVIDLT